jgi:hypothetical protein
MKTTKEYAEGHEGTRERRVLSCQFFKSQRVSSDHMTQRVDEQIGAFTAVEAEAHLVQVGLQVLRADFVPRSDDAALEQRKGILHSVGVNVSSEPDVLFGAVVHRLMPSVAHGFAVRAVIVGHDYVNIFRGRMAVFYSPRSVRFDSSKTAIPTNWCWPTMSPSAN